MIQDIYPSKLYNEFRKCEIEEKDYLLVFDEARFWLAAHFEA